MNKYKNLVSNTMLISAGTFGSKVLVFCMVRFYTSYMSTSDYGTADLITQTANLLIPLAYLGIQDSVFRFAMDDGTGMRTRLRNQVFSIGVLITTFGGIIMLLCLPFTGFIDGIKNYAILVVLYTIAACYHNVCAQYVRALEDTKLYAIQGIINTALVVSLNILFLAVLDMGITGYILSIILSDGLVTLILVFKKKLWSNLTIVVSRTLAKRMLLFSLPLIPNTVIWWVMGVSDRYMISYFIGTEANGIYSVAYKLPTIITIIATVFVDAWSISAVSEYGGDKREHARFYTNVWSVLVPMMFIMGSGMIMLSQQGIGLLAAGSYFTAWKYVPFLALAMVFSSLSAFLGSIYIVKKNSVMSLVTSAIGAVVNIIANLILIPGVGGVQGATVATMLSCVVVFVMRAFNGRKFVSMEIGFGKIALSTIIVILQAIIEITQLPLVWIWQCVALLLLVLIHFNSIKHILVYIPFIVKK